MQAFASSPFFAARAVSALVLCATAALAQDLQFIALPPPASPRDLLFNPISNKLYTANTPELGMPPAESVTIIDGATNTVITTLDMPAGSRDFCLNTQANKVYVANYFADTVTVIDGVTNQVLATIPVGDGPRALCYNSQDNRIYCANEYTGTVTVIDGASDAVVATVAVGSTPRVICYNPISNKIYCPNAGSQSVSVIGGATNTVVATVPVGNVPRGILFNPQNNRVYCSNYASDTVSVIDGTTNAVVATVPVGDGPTAMGHNPIGNKVYVSNVGAPGPGSPAACTVSVIGGASNTVMATLAAGDEPTAFAFNSVDGNMYWVNEWSHTLAVVDAASDTQELLVPLGTGLVQPVDLACNSITGFVYTANRQTLNIGALSPSSVGIAFCLGDGSGVSCPCGNNAAAGAVTGCLNSLGSGARLVANGAASIATDGLVLGGSGMPNSYALYFQGTGQVAAGSGATFGDGKRCAGGSLTRLGTKLNANGASSYPAVGEISISVRGAVPAGATRHYQAWYRNAAAFCTPGTFNLTNGVAVTWVP